MSDPFKITPVPGTPAFVTATIANAASLSGAVDLGKGRLARIVMPAAWTAAALTFQVSYDGVNYTDFHAQTAEYSFASPGVAAAAREILVNRVDWGSVRFLKVRSGTSGAPVAQGAQRDIRLVTLPSIS